MNTDPFDKNPRWIKGPNDGFGGFVNDAAGGLARNLVLFASVMREPAESEPEVLARDAMARLAASQARAAMCLLRSGRSRVDEILPGFLSSMEALWLDHVAELAIHDDPLYCACCRGDSTIEHYAEDLKSAIAELNYKVGMGDRAVARLRKSKVAGTRSELRDAKATLRELEKRLARLIEVRAELAVAADERKLAEAMVKARERASKAAARCPTGEHESGRCPGDHGK